MFNSKKIKLLSFTFLLSFLILFYIKNYPSTEKIFFNQNSIRNLIENSDVKEICEKSDSNLESYFKKPEYNFTFDENGNKWANYIIEYLRNDDTEEFINNYYKRVLPFLIFIALPIFLIFFWIGYCCCCCCPCCCCKQKGRENCCRFFSFLVALIMNGIVIVGCVYGFATTKNLINSMNDTTCVVMKTYLDVIEGENLEQSPKWIGSQNILDLLNQIIDELDHINELINNLSENKEELDEEYNEYLEFQRNKEEEIKNYVVTNPNVKNNNENKENVVPIYTKNRDEKIKDLNSYLQTIVDSIDELTENMQSLKNKDNIVDTKNKLNNAIDDIRDFESKFTEREDILNDWIKGQKEVNKYSKKGYYFFFVFIAGLAIISLILSLFLVGQVCFCFPKLFLHIIWNINQLLMILIFLLGGILGILGVLLTDGIDVFNYAISKENLNETYNNDPIIFTGSSREYLDICFNGNGSIIEKLDIKTDEIDSLNSAFQSYSNFSNLTSDDITKSFNDFNKYYEDIKNNMNNMIYDETYNVYKDLLNFDKYTDSENEDSRQSKSNNILINDIWRFYCSDEDTNCKIIKNYKDENMTLNYDKCILNDDEFTNLKKAADKYLVNFYKFDLNCNEQLDNIIKTNKEYKTKLDNISTIAEISLYNAKNITNILNEVFYQYVSNDNNILDILSCKFLRRDKNIILSELDNKFTSNVTKMSTDILTIACAMALGTFFLLIVINRYVDSKKLKNKPSKKSKKKIIEEKVDNKDNSDTVIENDDTVENV